MKKFSTMKELTPRGQLIIGGFSVNCERQSQEHIDANEAFVALVQASAVIIEKFDADIEVRDALIKAGAFIRATIRAQEPENVETKT